MRCLWLSTLSTAGALNVVSFRVCTVSLRTGSIQFLDPRRLVGNRQPHRGPVAEGLAAFAVCGARPLLPAAGNVVTFESLRRLHATCPKCYELVRLGVWVDEQRGIRATEDQEPTTAFALWTRGLLAGLRLVDEQLALASA